MRGGGSALRIVLDTAFNFDLAVVDLRAETLEHVLDRTFFFPFHLLVKRARVGDDFLQVERV